MPSEINRHRWEENFKTDLGETKEWRLGPASSQYDQTAVPITTKKSSSPVTNFSRKKTLYLDVYRNPV
jgi:hypothetical protein